MTPLKASERKRVQPIFRRSKQISRDNALRFDPFFERLDTVCTLPKEARSGLDTKAGTPVSERSVPKGVGPKSPRELSTKVRPLSSKGGEC